MEATDFQQAVGPQRTIGVSLSRQLTCFSVNHGRQIHSALSASHCAPHTRHKRIHLASPSFLFLPSHLPSLQLEWNGETRALMQNVRESHNNEEIGSCCLFSSTTLCTACLIDKHSKPKYQLGERQFWTEAGKR